MIELILGCMFSGKTSELIRIYQRFQIAKKRCIMIKHSLDDRYNINYIVSHSDLKIKCIHSKTLLNLNVNNYEVICIDEGQFFDDLVEFCEKEAIDKTIIVAGLDATFKTDGFPNILNLIPKCEIVRKLSAICVICGNDALFSERLSSETNVTVIGGSDKYMSVCRKCYYRNKIQ